MNRTEITSIHASFKEAIKEKYNILLKALEEDKRITIKWNEKKKEIKFYIEEFKRLWKNYNIPHLNFF